MMDIDNLLKELRRAERYCLNDYSRMAGEAATALSTLQAENEKMRAKLEYEKEHANAYYEECGQWEAENEKLRAGLEQVKKLYESEKEDFIDYACSGVPNLSPYCMNRRPDCVDERGWCRLEKCHGFSRDRGQKED